MFDKTVECRECKHIVRKEVAQRIHVYGGSDWFFCPEHKVKYTSVEVLPFYDYIGYIAKENYKYFRRMETDSDGVPYGWEKVEESTFEDAIHKIAMSMKRSPGRPKGSGKK